MHDESIGEEQHIWLREAARDLRRRSTATERQLWLELRGRKLAGHRFRRQHPIGPYVVDFLCFDARLVVEIDGEIHEHQREYDAERDDHLRQLGYRVLRIPSERVTLAIRAVLDQIEAALHAPPLPRAGEGAGG